MARSSRRETIDRLTRYKGGIGDPQTYVDCHELKRLVKPRVVD